MAASLISCVLSVEVWLKPNLLYCYNIGIYTCTWGQRSQTKVKSYVRSTSNFKSENVKYDLFIYFLNDHYQKPFSAWVTEPLAHNRTSRKSQNSIRRLIWDCPIFCFMFLFSNWTDSPSFLLRLLFE